MKSVPPVIQTITEYLPWLGIPIGLLTLGALWHTIVHDPREPAGRDSGGGRRSRGATNRLEWAVIAVVIVGMLGVAAIGFAVSFDTLRAKAVMEGFPRDKAWMVPAGVDLAIGVFTLLGLWRSWKGRPLAIVQPIVWLLIGGTVFLNIAGADAPPIPAAGAAVVQEPHDVGLWAYAAHGILPLLWAVTVEFANRVVRDEARIRDNRSEGIPVARWVLAPWPTALLYRRMRLWGVSDYAQALELEKARVLAECDLITTYGSVKAAPLREQALYRMGQLAPAEPVPPMHTGPKRPRVTPKATAPVVPATPATVAAPTPPATPDRDAMPRPEPVLEVAEAVVDEERRALLRQNPELLAAEVRKRLGGKRPTHQAITDALGDLINSKDRRFRDDVYGRLNGKTRETTGA